MNIFKSPKVSSDGFCNDDYVQADTMLGYRLTEVKLEDLRFNPKLPFVCIGLSRVQMKIEAGSAYYVMCSRPGEQEQVCKFSTFEGAKRRFDKLTEFIIKDENLDITEQEKD